jgi:hypothetical protein
MLKRNSLKGEESSCGIKKKKTDDMNHVAGGY